MKERKEERKREKIEVCKATKKKEEDLDKESVEDEKQGEETK